MVYCAKILVRYCYMLHGHHDFLFGFDQNLTQKKAFFGVHAEILLFLGFMQKYYCPELLHSALLPHGMGT